MRNWLTSSLLGLGLGLWLAEPVAGQDTPPEPPPLVNSPLSPEESQKHFQIDPDCRIELVAAEPDVSAPVSIAFDEKGQLWVVEMHDYPNGPAPGEPGKSRIRVLTDEDGDGKYSNPRVFVDQLLFANSLMHWDGGVLVTTDGKLIYFKDTDGDGKSDLREVWFEGFATENPQLRCNHPTFGPDNWIYVANGLRNGKVRAVRSKWPKPAPEGAKLGEPVDISGRDFRFNPFTGECEAVSGYGQFGLTFDDEGNRYVCSNRNPCMKVIIEERHLKLNPNLAVPRVVEDVSPAGEQSKLYPISRAWTTSNLHAGQFSAACGLIFYRGTSLPERFYNQSFTCDPTGNLVHFNNTAYNEAKREFLASDETWFRPVNTAMGPDGALYIVDMYRAVIEHPEYMPAELKTRPDLAIGAGRGRLWRITAKTGDPGGVSPRSALLPTDLVEIANLVKHPNGWHRDIAHRKIVESQEPNSASPLHSLLVSSSHGVSRAVALRALSGIGQVQLDDLLSLLKQQVRGDLLFEVLNQAERGQFTPAKSKSHVRLDLGTELASIQYRTTDVETRLRIMTLLEVLEDRHTCQRPYMAAITFLAAPNSESVMTRIIASNPTMLDRVARDCVGFLLGHPDIPPGAIDEAMKNPAEFRRCLQLLYGTLSRDAKNWHYQNETLKRCFEDSSPTHPNPTDPQNRARLIVLDTLTRSMRAGQIPTQSLFEKSGAWHDKLINRLQPLIRDLTLPPDVRIEAVRCLHLLPADQISDDVRMLLSANSPASVVTAALEVAGQLPEPSGSELLLSEFEQRSPMIRGTIISALLTSEQRITKLLDLVESNQVSFLEIGQTRLASLQQVKNPEIQARLQKLIAANAPADRSKVLEEYQAALAHEHDPLRGRELFAKNCAQCHKIGDLGVEVAPNISDSRVKTQAQLLTDILDPNRAIDNNYFSYTLVDKAGTVATGIISAETSSSVTLKQPEGKTLTVLRSDIEQLKPNGVSLMPVGFEKQLSVAQMADVISFVKNWRYLDGSVPKEVIK
jgi:putative membrane-bound dehydrogenase-like protein